MRTILAAAALAGLWAKPLAAQQDTGAVTPLFAQDEILDVTITGPVRSIARAAERSTEAYPGTLQAAGESHAIELSARGISRRKKENCRFPPLRIAFPDKAGKESLFHRQGSVKLVTHCQDRDKAEQTVLREYAAYRLYNLVTPESLKARLARITYIEDGKTLTTRLGFFIEDADDAARRLGAKEVDTGTIRSSALNREDAARYALFQYMIGNTDWDMAQGPNPAECCHNSKLLGAAKDARSDLTPVPYDFDNSGLVDAPYAVPNAILRIRTVRTRVYRGYCSLNDAVRAQVPAFRDMRTAFEAEIAGLSVAEPSTRSAMASYLSGFYDDIADNAALERNLLRKCR